MEEILASQSFANDSGYGYSLTGLDRPPMTSSPVPYKFDNDSSKFKKSPNASAPTERLTYENIVATLDEITDLLVGIQIFAFILSVVTL